MKLCLSSLYAHDISIRLLEDAVPSGIAVSLRLTDVSHGCVDYELARYWSPVPPVAVVGDVPGEPTAWLEATKPHEDFWRSNSMPALMKPLMACDTEQ